MPRFKISCGVKDFGLPSPPLEKACRTDSVLAITTDSGPAAARRPFFEAMPSREAVGGGRALLGHGEGKSRTLDSPAID